MSNPYFDAPGLCSAIVGETSPSSRTSRIYRVVLVLLLVGCSETSSTLDAEPEFSFLARAGDAMIPVVGAGRQFELGDVRGDPFVVQGFVEGSTARDEGYSLTFEVTGGEFVLESHGEIQPVPTFVDGKWIMSNTYSIVGCAPDPGVILLSFKNGSATETARASFTRLCSP